MKLIPLDRHNYVVAEQILAVTYFPAEGAEEAKLHLELGLGYSKVAFGHFAEEAWQQLRGVGGVLSLTDSASTGQTRSEVGALVTSPSSAAPVETADRTTKR